MKTPGMACAVTLLLCVVPGCERRAEEASAAGESVAKPDEATGRRDEIAAREAQREPFPDQLVQVPVGPRQIEAPGRWRKFRTHRFDSNLTAEQRLRIEQLESLGYVSGSRQRVTSEVIVRHDPSRAFAGLNFYVSGHAPEAVLMTMEGRVLHRWGRSFREVWPDYPVSDNHYGKEHWRRAYLFENGDILAIHEGLGILKLDRDSNLLWSSPVRTHHDLQVMPDGDIYVLAREAHAIPRMHPTSPILEDFLLVLGPNGALKRRVSILEAFENSDYADILRSRSTPYGDIFHTNTLVVLDGSIEHVAPSFAEGNVLIYILWMQTMAVLDPDKEKIVWARQDPEWYSHDPKILPNGNLLIFNNSGGGDLRQGGKRASRVAEFKSVSDEVAWAYEGTQREPFFSAFCGTAERLPNGNTLIVESDNGRAFEVTIDGEIAWEFHNPDRAGEEGEFIATLFDLVRLPPEFPTTWIVPAPGD